MHGSEWSATWGEGGRVREGFMEAVTALEEGGRKRSMLLHPWGRGSFSTFSV